MLELASAGREVRDPARVRVPQPNAPRPPAQQDERRVLDRTLANVPACARGTLHLCDGRLVRRLPGEVLDLRAAAGDGSPHQEGGAEHATALVERAADP